MNVFLHAHFTDLEFTDLRLDDLRLLAKPTFLLNSLPLENPY